MYDAHTRDIISVLYKLRDLLDLGVTVHAQLNNDRDAIEDDVPVVYFVKPTREAIDRIVADCAASLYGPAIINFTTPVDKSLLQSFADALVHNNCDDVVSRVVEQYSDYVSLESDMFTLNSDRMVRIMT